MISPGRDRISQALMYQGGSSSPKLANAFAARQSGLPAAGQVPGRPMGPPPPGVFGAQQATMAAQPPGGSFGGVPGAGRGAPMQPGFNRFSGTAPPPAYAQAAAGPMPNIGSSPWQGAGIFGGQPAAPAMPGQPTGMPPPGVFARQQATMAAQPAGGSFGGVPGAGRAAPMQPGFDRFSGTAPPPSFGQASSMMGGIGASPWQGAGIFSPRPQPVTGGTA